MHSTPSTVLVSTVHLTTSVAAVAEMARLMKTTVSAPTTVVSATGEPNEATTNVVITAAMPARIATRRIRRLACSRADVQTR